MLHLRVLLILQNLTYRPLFLCLLPAIPGLHMAVEENHHITQCSVAARLLGCDEPQGFVVPASKNAWTLK